MHTFSQSKIVTMVCFFQSFCLFFSENVFIELFLLKINKSNNKNQQEQLYMSFGFEHVVNNFKLDLYFSLLLVQINLEERKLKDQIVKHIFQHLLRLTSGRLLSERRMCHLLNRLFLLTLPTNIYTKVIL